MTPTSKKLSKKPLSGTRVLVGRARHQAGALSALLINLGAEVMEIPFIEIRKPKSYAALNSALENLHTYDWLILTSVNGVEALWERLKKLKISKRHLKHVRIAAIGPATKKAIEKGGLHVDVVPKEYVAESVVESLRDQIAGKRVLLARAKVARDVIPTELQKLGAKVDVIEAYETVIPQSSRRRLQAVLKNPKRRPHVITFASSSSVKNFVELSGKNVWRGRPRPRALEGIRMASIGPVTSATLQEFGLSVDIEAKQFTIPGLIEAIVKEVAPASRRPPGLTGLQERLFS